MHPRTTGKIKEVNKLLLELIAAGVLTSVAAGLSGNPRRESEAFRALATFSKARIRQALARLRMQGMIQYDPEDERAPLRITKDGLVRRDRYRVRSMRKTARPKKWDYLWRLVIFDIPERSRHLREALRYELLQLGFFMLQESVYAIPFDCSKEVDEIGRQLHIRRDLIIVCVTPSLGKSDARARNHFIKRAMAPKNF